MDNNMLPPFKANNTNTITSQDGNVTLRKWIKTEDGSLVPYSPELMLPEAAY